MSNCCEDHLKAQNVLESVITSLRNEKDHLETTIEGLNREVSDAQSAEEAAEEMREDAYDAKDSAVAALRDEKDRELTMLRRLEFCLHGLCPLCLGVVEHKTGCELKLAIWRLDHELVRTEYAD